MANTNGSGIKMLGLLILVICSPTICFSQLTDNFSDSDLSSNPKWVGTLGHFLVNDAHQLQLNSLNPGFSYLSTQSSFSENCEWQIQIKQAFSPSANNYCRIYLFSNKKSLTARNQQAYYLQLGEKGSKDAIELFRQNGNEVYSICRGAESSISSSFNIRLKVIKDKKGNWVIYVDKNGGQLFSKEAEGQDQYLMKSGYFGMLCKYTSGNKRRFYFDDIYVGTPRIDDTPPKLISYEVIQANRLELTFSESLHLNCLNDLKNFIVSNNIGNPTAIEANENFKTFQLYFKDFFEEDFSYEIQIKNIKDFFGNLINPTNFKFRYYVAKTNDLVINEILLDPLSNGEEYTEIYNRSQKKLNLKKLFLGRIKNSFPNPPDTVLTRITNTSFYILPKEYWVMSKSTDKVKQIHTVRFPNHLINTPNLPSLINESGHLILLSDSGVLVDEIKYSEKMHHPNLNFTDGIALERIHFNISGMDKNNWQSASEASGFGTPTYKNSQFTEVNFSKDFINISPKVFTPNQDGIDDLLSITINLKEGSYSVNVIIYNSNGQQVRYLVKNSLLGTNAQYFWNGLDEDGNSLPHGIYIIYVELFNLDGKIKAYKQSVVLGKQF
jgi:flagellar hook assembly protein FlgD